MSIKKFIASITEYLGLDGFKSTGKKNSIKTLLAKLEDREEKIIQKISKSDNKKACKELKEELGIIKMQIKKGKKILDKLT